MILLRFLWNLLHPNGTWNEVRHVPRPPAYGMRQFSQTYMQRAFWPAFSRYAGLAWRDAVAGTWRRAPLRPSKIKKT